VICLLPDPARHVLRNGRFLPDRQSVAFSAFGYSPILPLVLQERGAISHSSVMRAAGGLLARADLLESYHAPARPDVRQATRSAIAAATKLAAMGVVVVMPPDGDADIRGALGADTDVPVVDLGDVPILRSDELRLDRFHLSAGGHSRAADAVAPAVLQLVHAAEPGRR
jgi:hypothetical protein